MGDLYVGNFGTFLFISIQTNLYKRGSGEWGPKRFRNHSVPQKTYIFGGFMHISSQKCKIWEVCYYMKDSFAI